MSVRHTWDPLDDLSQVQSELLDAFEQLVVQANKRANLVSRPSIADIRQIHIRHSLALSVRGFHPGSKVVDWGTGGGLPGIPLAIRFPQVQFVLVDSIGKKTDLVRAIAMKLGLNNVQVEQIRAESWDGTCDVAVSRATAPLVNLWSWSAPILADSPNIVTASTWNSGLLALKGGDLGPEIDELKNVYPETRVTVTAINDFMAGPFKDKFVVEVRRAADGRQSAFSSDL